MAHQKAVYPTAPPLEAVHGPQPYPSQPMVYPAPPAGPPIEVPPQVYATGGQVTVQQGPHTTVVVQQKPTVQPQPKQKKGMFASFMDGVDKVGKQLGKEVDYCSKKVGDAVDKNVSSSLLGLFGSYNVVQLVPRSTGKTVQILLNTDGRMFLDGNGHLDPNLYNSLWTVINEGNNQVRLHNNNNYLAVVQGYTTILPIVPGVTLSPETKFQLSQVNSEYLTLESLIDREKFVAFYSTGQIKPASKRDLDSHFAVKLVSTAYPGVYPVRK